MWCTLCVWSGWAALLWLSRGPDHLSRPRTPLDSNTLIATAAADFDHVVGNCPPSTQHSHITSHPAYWSLYRSRHTLHFPAVSLQPADHCDMSSAKLRLAFVLIGLPLDHPSIPAHIRPTLQQSVAAVWSTLSRANCSISPLHVAETDLPLVVSYLKDRPETNGVVIGMGVRSSKELTPFFEQLVESVRLHAPQAKLMFNSSPTDTLEAIQRWFPEVAIVEP